MNDCLGYRRQDNGIQLVEDGPRIVTDATDIYGFSSYRSAAHCLLNLTSLGFRRFLALGRSRL